MTEKARDVLQAALRLDVHERAIVAAEILASMDGENEEDASRAWAREIDARIARAKAGCTDFSDWSEVDARLGSKHFGE
jgi:hypothetical protein